MAKDANVMATSGKQWRAGHLIQLPSGNWVRLRPISITMLVSIKTIPNELMTVVQEWIEGERSVEITPEQVLEKVGGTVGSLRAGRAMYEAYAIAAFVQPRIVPEPQGDDEISVLDIDDDDLRFVYDFMGRPASELASFSEECFRRQDAGLEPLSDLQGFFDPTERDVGRAGEKSADAGLSEGQSDGVEVRSGDLPVGELVGVENQSA